MSRIAKIALEGFKGLERTYELDGATVLSGPNGAGKSAALEGLVYAVTGRVPEGKSLDVVAHYFPPRGGTVTITDTDGRWIRRGITRDHEKRKVSEVLETSETEDGQPVDVSAWKANPIVFDARELLGLSPAKSREAVLRLTGQGEADPDEIEATIAKSYAREIAGPAATAATLEDPSDLPEAEQALAGEWPGLRDVVRSYMQSPDGSATQLFLALGAAAKTARLAARKSATEAKAAIRELEAEVQGAKAAAAELRARRHETELAREKLTQGREEAARREEAEQAAAKARERVTQWEERIATAKAAAKKMPKPGPRPEMPGNNLARYGEIEKELEALAAEAEKLKTEHSKIVDLEWKRDDTVQKLETAVAELQAHEQEPIGVAATLIDAIPDAAHPNVPQLRAVLAQLAESWCTRKRLLEWRRREFLDYLHELTEKVAKLDERRMAFEAARTRVTEAETALKAERNRLRAEQKAAEDAYSERLTAWRTADNKFRVATQELERAEAALTTAKEDTAAASKRVDTLSSPDLDALEAALYRCEAALKVAEEAAGALRAYEDAKTRAARGKLAETAWKHAEAAIATAREQFVGAEARELLADINAIFERAGREERAYLLLENERGRPIFELGWARNGARCAFGALSGGEAVLFCAALSLAIARRAEGRRLLLIEADPLDEHNLPALLRALAPSAEDVEALVVATASHIDDGFDSWNVVHV